MYCRWMLFRLEMKKLIKMLPLILVETLLFALIVAGTGAYAVKALYGDQVVGEIKVGISADSEDSMTKMLIRFVQSMDSLKDTLSFVLLPEEEARKQVEEGTLYAAVMVPDGMVDSILSGENLPVGILLGNSYSRMETGVFAQLTGAGAKLLTVAQAGIYAADTFCLENGMQDRIRQTEDYLNEVYLKYAAARVGIFRTREVSAVKGVGIADYYVIALLIAFLSFVGLSLGRCIEVNVGERKRLLSARGISAGEQYLMEAGGFGVLFAVMGMIISLPVCLLFAKYQSSSFRVSAAWAALFLVWLCAGAFLRLLLQITGNSVGGIGACFVILLAFLFAAGIFVPEAFLPLWIGKAGGFLPFKGWMEAMTAILQSRMDGQLLFQLLLQLIVFLALGALVAVVRSGRKR